MGVGKRQLVLVLALQCVLVAHIFEFAHARASITTTTDSYTPCSMRTTPSIDCSTSRSAPTETVESASSTAATTASSVNTATICSSDGIARIMMLNQNNLHLQSQCTTSAGLGSYVFPFSGKLSYAQMVAMSTVGECSYYFRAILMVQLQECVDTNVYIRTTAETILQLGVTKGKTPTEAEVNAAVAVRKTYNLALRDGNDSATSGASALSWHIEGNTNDTAVANTAGQLLLSSDLHIIGTYYASSDPSSTSTIPNVQDARPPGQTIDISEAVRKRELPWLIALTFACATLLLHEQEFI